MEPAYDTIRRMLELGLEERQAIRAMMAAGARCPGLQLEPGVWSGCDQGASGATDCPIHGADFDATFREALAALERLGR